MSVRRRRRLHTAVATPRVLADGKAGPARGNVQTVPAWRQNWDYVLVAHLSWIVPGFLRRLFGVSAADASGSHDLGLRRALPADKHGRAMSLAFAFWLFSMSTSFLLAFIILFIIGVAKHTMLGGPIIVLPAAFFGWTVFSASCLGFSAIRYRNLNDPVIRRFSRTEIPRSAQPKPYDTYISIAAGIIAALTISIGPNP